MGGDVRFFRLVTALQSVFQLGKITEIQDLSPPREANTIPAHFGERDIPHRSAKGGVDKLLVVRVPWSGSSERPRSKAFVEFGMGLDGVL